MIGVAPLVQGGSQENAGFVLSVGDTTRPPYPLLPATADNFMSRQETQIAWESAWSAAGSNGTSSRLLLLGLPPRAVASDTTTVISTSPTVVLPEGVSVKPGVISEGQLVLFELRPKHGHLPAYSALKVTVEPWTTGAATTTVGCDAIPPVVVDGTTVASTANPSLAGVHFVRRQCSVVYILAGFSSGGILTNVSWARAQAQRATPRSTVDLDTQGHLQGQTVIYFDDDVREQAMQAEVTTSSGQSANPAVAVSARAPVDPRFTAPLQATVTPSTRERVDWYVTVRWSLSSALRGKLQVHLTDGLYKVPSLPARVNVTLAGLAGSAGAPVAFAVTAPPHLGAVCVVTALVEPGSAILARDSYPSLPSPAGAGFPAIAVPHRAADCFMLPTPGTDIIVVLTVFFDDQFPNATLPIHFVGVANNTRLSLPPPPPGTASTNASLPLVPGALSLTVDLPDDDTPFLLSLLVSSPSPHLPENVTSLSLFPQGLYWYDEPETMPPLAVERWLDTSAILVDKPALITAPRGVRRGFSLLGSLDVSGYDRQLANLTLTITATPITSLTLGGPPLPLPFTWTTAYERPVAVAALRIPSLLPFNQVRVELSEEVAIVAGRLTSIPTLPRDVFADGHIMARTAYSSSNLTFGARVTSGGAPDDNDGVGFVWLMAESSTVLPTRVTARASPVATCGRDIRFGERERDRDGDGDGDGDDDTMLLHVNCVGRYTVRLPPGTGPTIVRVDTVAGGGDGVNYTTTLTVGPVGYATTPRGGLPFPSAWVYIPDGEQVVVHRLPAEAGAGAGGEEEVTLRLTLEPPLELCSPIGRCSGNGHCAPISARSAHTSPCVCLSGFGYEFSGDTCATKGRGHLPILTAFVLVVFALAAAAVGAKPARRACFGRQRVEPGMDLVVNGEEDADAADCQPLLAAAVEDGTNFELDPVRIDLHGVSLVVRDADSGRLTPLLSDVSCSFSPRHVTAVLGPSGCGKTILLRTLAGWSAPTAGSITLNRDVLLTTKTPLGAAVALGFVPQEDILTPQLTVREALDHAARLRHPHGHVQAARDLTIRRVLAQLDLTSVADATIGTIGQSTLSGGQRRRVSIGLELVSSCSVLLLDEPTMGLSSTGSLQVMRILASIAASGVTVVAVIHQPRREILRHIDHLVVLAEGRVRYAGAPTTEETLAALGGRAPEVAELLRGGPRVNVADVVVDFVHEFPLVTGETLRSAERVRSSADRRRLRRAATGGGGGGGSSESDEEGERHCSSLVVLDPVIATPRLPRRLGWFSQVALFARRATRQTTRSPGTLAVLYGLTLLVSLLLGGVFAGSRYVGPAPSALVAQCPQDFLADCTVNQEDSYFSQGSMIALALGLSSVAAFLTTFGGVEKSVFLRESRTGASSDSAYFVGKLLAETPHLLASPLLFTLLFASLSIPTLPTPSLYLVCLGVVFACSGAAHVFAIKVAAGRSLIYATIFVAASLLAGGVSPSVQQIESALGVFLGRTLPRLSFAHWTIEAYYLGVVQPFSAFYETTAALAAVRMAPGEESLALALPFLFGLLFRLLALFFVIRMDKLKFT
jgi:ABC-type multidrug transport system ATPase subunit